MFALRTTNALCHLEKLAQKQKQGVTCRQHFSAVLCLLAVSSEVTENGTEMSMCWAADESSAAGPVKIIGNADHKMGSRNLVPTIGKIITSSARLRA